MTVEAAQQLVQVLLSARGEKTGMEIALASIAEHLLAEVEILKRRLDGQASVTGTLSDFDGRLYGCLMLVDDLNRRIRKLEELLQSGGTVH